jgi:hypothetical protein
VGTDADLSVASLGTVGDRHVSDMYAKHPRNVAVGGPGASQHRTRTVYTRHSRLFDF